MADLLDRLRQRGWRITPQRRAVAQALVGPNLHLTAEQVLERAQAILPEVSLATVYNTLREMVGMGEVLEVNSGGPTRYEPNAVPAHHHLTCLSCEELLDVYPAGVDELRLDDSHGYEISRLLITYEGICSRCVRSRAFS